MTVDVYIHITIDVDISTVDVMVASDIGSWRPDFMPAAETTPMCDMTSTATSSATGIRIDAD
ncbi:MAG: hypothetical protein RKO66_18435 [Candidatus Contendobacter sp.]|nr:hypothetical protein [Candidatus Contendobacter sp.]MDS4060393.1 hypothetical protein [Candidatus Contendobacter sp.]